MKKGFTLIELLAVIVILAIIAMIATPIILNIINDTKKEATIRSTENYLDAVEQAIARENLNGEFNPTTCTIIESDTEDGYKQGDLDCDTGKLKVEVDGEKPKSGTITFDKGKIKDVTNLDMGGIFISTGEDGKLTSSSEKIEIVDTWDGTSKSTALKGCGTEENPYLIQSAADLIYMRDQVNAGADITLLDTTCGTDVIASAKSASYKQTVNIALNDTSNYSSWNESTTGLNSWSPIGVEYWDSANSVMVSNKFGGTYDGNNHTIAGIYSTSQTSNFGLFGFVTSTTIENLGITDLYVTNTTYMGSLIGLAQDTTNGTIINNCYAEGYIKGSYDLGGLIGYFSTAPLSIKNSYSNVKIDTTGSEVGGIAGFVTNVSSLNIENTYNYNNITGSSSSSYVGGIFGRCNGISSTSIASINNVYNEGDVTGYENSGGVVGYFNSFKTVTITNTYNTGDISASYYKAGGIIGSISNNTSVSITKTYNIGNVYGKSSDAGGIFGSIPSTSGEYILDEVYNQGEISSDGYNVGGLIGQSQTSTTIKNSYNRNNVSGNDYVGGIIGNISYGTNSIMKNVYNNATLTANSANYLNGLSYNVNEITNCYNTGTMNFNTTSSYAYVSGINYGSSSIIKNTHNSATLVDKSQVTTTTVTGIASNAPTTSENNSYLSSFATNAYYYSEPNNTGVTVVTDASSMPSVLSVVNADNKFIEDTKNINGGYPILSWQQ